MKYTVRNTRVLLLVGLLIYTASMFPMWYRTPTMGTSGSIWSFRMSGSSCRGPLRITTFFDYWLSSGFKFTGVGFTGVGFTFFVSIIFTLFFGFTALLWGVEKRFGWILLVPVLVFSVMPVGRLMLLFCYFEGGIGFLNLDDLLIQMQGNLGGMKAGFGMACFAIVLLALSFHERCFREKPVPDASTIIWSNSIESFNDASKILTSANIHRLGQYLLFSAGIYNLIYMTLFNYSFGFQTITWVLACLIVLSALLIRPRSRIIQISTGMCAILLSIWWWLSITYPGRLGMVYNFVIDWLKLTQTSGGMSIIGLILAFLGGSIRIFYHQEE